MYGHHPEKVALRLQKMLETLACLCLRLIWCAVVSVEKTPWMHLKDVVLVGCFVTLVDLDQQAT